MNVKNIYLALISDSVIFYENGNKLECQFSIIYVQKTYILRKIKKRRAIYFRNMKRESFQIFY